MIAPLGGQIEHEHRLYGEESKYLIPSSFRRGSEWAQLLCDAHHSEPALCAILLLSQNQQSHALREVVERRYADLDSESGPRFLLLTSVPPPPGFCARVSSNFSKFDRPSKLERLHNELYAALAPTNDPLAITDHLGSHLGRGDDRLKLCTPSIAFLDVSSERVAGKPSITIELLDEVVSLRGTEPEFFRDVRTIAESIEGWTERSLDPREWLRRQRRFLNLRSVRWNHTFDEMKELLHLVSRIWNGR